MTREPAAEEVFRRAGASKVNAIIADVAARRFAPCTAADHLVANRAPGRSQTSPGAPEKHSRVIRTSKKEPQC